MSVQCAAAALQKRTRPGETGFPAENTEAVSLMLVPTATGERGDTMRVVTVGNGPAIPNKENVIGPLIPFTVAVAVRLPAAVGIATTSASPLVSVVAVALEKARPAPLKLTVTPAIGLFSASLTTTSSGSVNRLPTAAVCPFPWTRYMTGTPAVTGTEADVLAR